MIDNTYDRLMIRSAEDMIIIIIIFISSIKTIEPVFSLFFGTSRFNRYGFECKNGTCC